MTLPSYRGDNINRAEFTAAAREPDPQLLLRGYERAALTLNFVRALVDGGFADLHHPEYWDLNFLQHSPAREAYEKVVRSIGDALDFFEGMTGGPVEKASLVSMSTPATRACTCSTSRRRRASSRACSAGTTCPPTCRGSACARRSWMARTWNISAASPTPSA